MRTLPIASFFLSLALLPTPGCSSDDTTISVVEGFGERAGTVDRLHTYAAFGRVDFVVNGESLRPEFTVSSSDERVFRVDRVEAEEVPGLGSDSTALEVFARSAGPGTANLVIRNGRGEVVASRALTFVTVDGVVFTRALALLGGVEAPVDPANLAIGERGAEFFIRFTAGERQNVQGREVISFPEPTPAVVLADERAFFTLETSRDFVHIEPVAVPTALAFTLAGSADARSMSLLPGEASAVEFVTKAALRARLEDAEADPELAARLAAGGDERVLCDGERCVAKVEPKDADGRVIFGAGISWTLPGEAEPRVGDLLAFEPGDEENTVRATLDDVELSLTVRAAPDSLDIASSSEVTSCASVGTGGSGLALLGLVTLARRRRR
jgi:MYXO-CTERM domain-containing protein